MKLINFSIALIIFTSCVSEVDVQLPHNERIVTLNCVLQPDNDTIIAHLAYSRQLLLIENFEDCKDAEVRLFEGSKFSGYFEKSDSTAWYLPYRVIPGKDYKIEVTINEKTVWAETRVPVNFEAGFTAIKDYAESFNYIISITRNPSEKSVYWISAKGFSWYNGKPFYDIAPAIYSDCSFADDFNRLVEQGYGYMYIYEYYIRLISEEVPTDTISVQFHPAGIHIIDGSQEVFVLSVDYHLDKYMKSSILLEEIDMYAEDVPIVYAPFPIYTNINGGTGIFGSYNSVSEKFEGK